MGHARIGPRISEDIMKKVLSQVLGETVQYNETRDAEMSQHYPSSVVNGDKPPLRNLLI